MKKLKVDIHSLEIPTVGFIDKEGAMHSCAHAQKTAFQGLERFSSIGGKRYLSDEEREVLMHVEDFCKNNGLEFEVIDLGTISFLARLKLKMKGLKTPAVSYREKILYSLPGEEDLKKLLKS
jgi:hypothetical protein